MKMNVLVQWVCWG